MRLAAAIGRAGRGRVNGAHRKGAGGVKGGIHAQQNVNRSLQGLSVYQEKRQQNQNYQEYKQLKYQFPQHKYYYSHYNSHISHDAHRHERHVLEDRDGGGKGPRRLQVRRVEVETLRADAAQLIDERRKLNVLLCKLGRLDLLKKIWHKAISIRYSTVKNKSKRTVRYTCA